MSDRTPEENLEAVRDVMAAFDRLTAPGLATRDPHGVTTAGMTTLGDLLSVLVFQTGGSDDHVEQVLSASARATASALADLFADMAGTPTDGNDTLKLLRAAITAARSDT